MAFLLSIFRKAGIKMPQQMGWIANGPGKDHLVKSQKGTGSKAEKELITVKPGNEGKEYPVRYCRAQVLRGFFSAAGNSTLLRISRYPGEFG